VRGVKARKCSAMAYQGRDFRKRTYKRLPNGQIIADYDRKFYQWLKVNGLEVGDGNKQSI
jgi:ribosomal protein L34E